jgi:hypothetical protein
MNSPNSRFSHVYLLPGRNESIKPLYDVLSYAFTDNVTFFQPCMPTSKAAEFTLDWVRTQLYSQIKPNSLFVGVGLGGLLAAVVQRYWPHFNLSAVAINASTSEDSLMLGDTYLTPELVAFYSPAAQDVNGLRCAWGCYTDKAFALPWLQHGIDGVRYAIGYLVSAHMRGLDIAKEIEVFPQAAAVAQ